MSNLFFIFFLNRAMYEIIWKNNGRAGQATDKNMAHGICA
jgi:hypothetical protein